jgi:NAD(P)-dependent dehydrogenase (short-subunit alcohol dehydrogenase family)
LVKKMDEMKGKVALITGGSSGIGRSTAFKFASEGVKVAPVARRAERLAEVARLIEAQGGTAKPVVCDLTKEADIERAVRDTVAGFGGIDVLVNAAGISGWGGIETTSLQDWDHMMNVNVRAIVQLTQHSLPYLVERKGSIVNVTSVAGIRAYAGMLSYCVSKAAVEQLTRCIALDVAGKGVRANAVCPSVITTEVHRAAGMSEEEYSAFLERSKTTHPLGRVGRPEEVAELIFFLTSPKAAWITGASYLIDGGRSQTCPL